MPRRKIHALAKLAIFVAILVPMVGTIGMALGNWLGFDANNPVVKAVYVCVVAAAAVIGLLQLAQIDSD